MFLNLSLGHHIYKQIFFDCLLRVKQFFLGIKVICEKIRYHLCSHGTHYFVSAWGYIH